MILEKLRQNTRIAHEKLESELNLFERCLEKRNYKSVLKKFYGYYEPLQSKVLALGLNEDAMQIQLRCQWLEDDLKGLEGSFSKSNEFQFCENLPYLTGEASVLGFRYVLEGSTLGGQVITRHFRTQWNQQNIEGLSFFNAHGDETGKNWKNFLNHLKTKAELLSQDEEILRGARETFESLLKWIRDER
jgi:heme oxygenase